MKNDHYNLAFQQFTKALLRKLESMINQPQKTFHVIPKSFRTPNCAKTQNILADAYSTAPLIRAEYLERADKDQPLNWLNAIQLQGKVTNSTNVARLIPSNSPMSPPPMANIRQELSPREPEPIIIEDEETPIADISKGSENEIQLYTARLQLLESKLSLESKMLLETKLLLEAKLSDIQKNQQLQHMKAKISKCKFNHVKNELASAMRKLRKLEPLIPKKRSSKRRPTPRRISQNQRLRQIRQQRIIKARMLQINRQPVKRFKKNKKHHKKSA